MYLPILLRVNSSALEWVYIYLSANDIILRDKKKPQ